MVHKIKFCWVLFVMLCTQGVYANDEFAPFWRGFSNTAKIVYNFDNPANLNQASLITGPDAGLITAGVLPGLEFGTQACQTAGQQGVVTQDNILSFFTNVTFDSEHVIVRIQITSTLTEIPFIAIESAEGYFADPGFQFCDGIEITDNSYTIGQADLGNGLTTLAYEVLLTNPSGCENIQILIEGMGGACLDEVIIDTRHDLSTLYSIVAAVEPPSVTVIEGQSSVDMVVTIDPSMGPVTDNVTLTLDSFSGEDVKLNNQFPPLVLNFTSVNWQTPQTVSVSGVSDPHFESCIETFIFPATFSSLSDPQFDNGIAQSNLEINVQDVDTGCIFLDAVDVELNELNFAGDTGTLVYVANRAPDFGTVTVNVTDGLIAGSPLFVADPSQLVINAANWATPQSVSLFAVQDSELKGTQFGSGVPSVTTAVTNLIISPGGDSFFTGVPDPVEVFISEDECGALPLSGFDFNQDCHVDVIDLTIFMEDWLACTHPAGC